MGRRSGDCIVLAWRRRRFGRPPIRNLYTCSVTLTTPYGESAVEERFGIRHAEFVDHGPFKLNGERLLLKGTQRHMDHAEFAAAEPDKLIRTEMELAKAMGANFIRLGHYQQARLVLDLCDELGLLVWEEAPWCRSGVGDEKWKDHTRAHAGQHDRPAFQSSQCGDVGFGQRR